MCVFEGRKGEKMYLIAEEGYRNLSGGENSNCGPTSGFSTMTMPWRMIC
jgi:hypothetical protein